MKDKVLRKICWSSYIFFIFNLFTLGFGLMEIYELLNIPFSTHPLLYALFIPEFIAIVIITFCEKKLRIKERRIVL